MKQLSFWAFAAAIILSGCASEEISDQHDLQGENGRKAITVSTYLPGHTRGYNAMQAGISDLAQGMGNGFIMSAMMGNDTIINGVRYYADPKTNECFTADETVYTWPDEESDLTFMAYYPASEQMCSLDLERGTLTFTPDGETDIMAANDTVNARTNNGNVALTFNHLLAHVRMNVACSDDVAGASFTLTGLSLEAPETAVYNYERGEVSLGSDATKTYSFITSDEEQTDLTTSGDIIGSVMVPTREGVTHHLEVDYSVTIGKTTKEYTKETDVELQAGFVNILKITVKSDKLITITTEVNPWVDGDTIEIDFAENDMTDLSGEDGDGRRYIDLGLPSRTLWAAWNIGAYSPEEAGGYYAWGETDTKDGQYIDNTYTWICDSEDDPYRRGSGKDELDLADDAAYANWSEGWCMPSLDQFQELINEEYTTWAYETLGDMPGVRFTSKKFPENSIFLPAAGGNNGNVIPVGHGNYWTRSRYEDSSSDGFSYRFSVSDTDPRAGGMDNTLLRSYGLSVRAVRY